MKKVLIVILVLIALIAGGAWYFISNAGGFIKAQIEKQGSTFLGTQVSVVSVDLALSQARLTISDIDVENPQGFSQSDAFSLGSITVDLGNVSGEPFTVQNVTLNAPEVLYEVDASGKGNLLVLKDQLMANLPKSEPPPSDEPGMNPLVIIENVTVSNVRLKLNFEKLNTGGLDIGEKVYEVTLPTFEAGSIGKPSGIPADQAGAAIANAMLDNIIDAAKDEAKKRAKAKAKEKFDKEKERLLKRAEEKLKNLF